MSDSSTFVGWAKRSVPTIHSADQDGGHASLCPPYGSTSTNSPAAGSAPSLQTPACWLAGHCSPVSSVNTSVLRPRHRHAAMAGGVAITVAGRPRRAGFRQAPVGRKALAHLARQQFCVRLRRRANALHRLVRNIHQQPPRVAGIDHGAAEEIGGSAGHRQQRRRDQAAGRGFRNGNRLFPLDQLCGDLVRLMVTSSFMFFQPRRSIRFSTVFLSVLSASE